MIQIKMKQTDVEPKSMKLMKSYNVDNKSTQHSKQQQQWNLKKKIQNKQKMDWNDYEQKISGMIFKNEIRSR